VSTLHDDPIPLILARLVHSVGKQDLAKYAAKKRSMLIRPMSAVGELRLGKSSVGGKGLTICRSRLAPYSIEPNSPSPRLEIILLLQGLRRCNLTLLSNASFALSAVTAFDSRGA
jgi:hypothetical protein